MTQAMDEFLRGVAAGYNSIKPGVIPPKLGMPSVPAGVTLYQLGYKKGVEAAKR